MIKKKYFLNFIYDQPHIFVIFNTIYSINSYYLDSTPKQDKMNDLIKPKGYYTKQLASLEDKEPKFLRNKKGIKKENKQICKESRQKKKKYITQLQRIKKDQEQQIQQLKQEITTLRHTLRQKQKMQSADPMHSANRLIIKDLVDEYKYLVQAINNEDSSAIRRSLTILRAQFSISGKDRKLLINDTMIQLISFTMPMHFRILMQHCQDNHKFYDLIGGSKGVKPYLLTLTEDKKMILKQMKPKIRQAKDNFNKILHKLHQIHGEIQRYGEEYQKIIDQIETKVNHPLFIGNLLLHLDGQRNHASQIYLVSYYKKIQDANVVFYDYNSNHYQLEEEENMAFQDYFMENL